MSITIPFDLTDEQLVEAIPRLAGDERQVTARLVAHLAELDRRRLYVARGYSSLYVYCREGLGYSEDAAHNRKVAAQVARRYPAVIGMLADGRLSLTAVLRLAPVLRDDTWPAVLAEAAGKSKREVEHLVARLAPKPDVPSTVRKLPMPSAAVPERQRGGGTGGKGGQAAGAVPERQAEGDDAEDPRPERQDPSHPTGCHAAGSSEAGGPVTSSDAGEPVTLAPQPSAATKRPIVAPLSPERYRVQFTIGEEPLRRDAIPRSGTAAGRGSARESRHPCR